MRGPFAGRYELLRRIGEGSHARIYRARHLYLDQFVALKIKRKTAPRGSVRQEGQLLARLRHPAFVRPLDGGVEHDAEFIVLELLRGRTVEQAVDADGPMCEARALAIVDTLIGALRHAHGLGIVICDVKPGNLMLTEEGELRIFDLGIACAVGEAQSGRVDRVAGTWGYVPPDAIETGHVDPRRDQYAAAASLYRMLSGRLPYAECGTRAESRRAHQSSCPPPIGGVSASVMAAIAKALSDDRYCDIAAFGAALRAAG